MRDFKPAILFEHDQKRLSEMQLQEGMVGEFLGDLGYSCFEIVKDGAKAELEPFSFDRRMQTNNLLALAIE